MQLIWYLCALSSAQAPLPSPAAVLDGLAAGDRAAHVLEVELRYPSLYYDRSQGDDIAGCVVGVEGETVATRCKVRQTQPLGWRSPETPGYSAGDYQSDGRLFAWRLAESLSFTNAEESRNLRRVWREAASERPAFYSGVPRPPVPVLYVYTPGSPSAYPTVWQGQLALGRGFTRFLERIDEVEPDGDLLQVTAHGRFGSEGVWDLKIDPAGWVVVEASFSQEGREVLATKAERDRQDPAPYASKGTFSLRGGPRTSVAAERKGYRAESPADWAAEVRREIATTEPGRVVESRH